MIFHPNQELVKQVFQLFFHFSTEIGHSSTIFLKKYISMLLLNQKTKGGERMKKTRLIAAIISALAAVFAFAANAFAAAPCGGPLFEPEMPEKLRR